VDFSLEKFETFLHKDPAIVSRKIAGETILVPVRQAAGDMSSIYTLNDTAARAWELMDGAHSLVAIRDQIVLEYEVSPQEMETDLLELVSQLQEIGLIIEPKINSDGGE
jgi:hypothetical protein